MSAILIAGLAFIAIAIAAYPLFKFDLQLKRVPTIDAALENLLSEREATYSAIKDLEFDHAQGKISEADFTDLHAKYETKALGILQQLHSFGKPAVRSVERPLHLPDSGCPRCGEPFHWSDKFCRSCGEALSAKCRTCGAAIGPDDKFCARCGKPSAGLQPA